MMIPLVFTRAMQRLELYCCTVLLRYIVNVNAVCPKSVKNRVANVKIEF